MTLPSTVTSEVRLSDLLELSVPIAWHEAVAVVRDVARQLPSGARGVVDPGAITLTREGRLLVSDGFGGGPDGLVPALAALLHRLLPSAAPIDLQVLADDNNPTIRQATEQEFIGALTFFARPDDAAELVALAEKAFAALDAQDRQAALQALTERARQTNPVAAPTSPATRKPLISKRIVAAAMMLIVMTAAVAGGWWLVTRRTPSSPVEAASVGQAEGVAQRVQHGLVTAAQLVSTVFESEPTAVAGRGKDIELPRRRASRPKKSGVAAEGPVVAPVPAVIPEPPASLVSNEHLGALTASADVSHGLAAAPHGVYSATHPDVIPPALLRVQMPEAPLRGLPVQRPGVLELMVDEGGQVQSAKLIPASSRYQDRMMISAAKTWRFAPAMRNGQAVRYRLEMPITW